MLVEVVAVGVGAGTLEEDLVGAALEHCFEVAAVGLGGYLHARGSVVARALEAAHDVAHLGLDQAEVGLAVEAVGPEDRKPVGKARDAHTLVCLQPVGVPPLLELDAADPAHLKGRHVARVEHLEPGGEHEHVDGVLVLVGRSHPLRRDRLDCVRHEQHVFAVEGGDVLV